MVSDSMAPSIKDQEVVVVDYTAYASSEPARWDVVAFESNTNGSTWLHRIVGLPGETIELVGGNVKINGILLTPPSHLSYLSYDTMPGIKIAFPYVIPKDHYFLLGDNSPVADDSRFNGTIHRDKIIGRVEDK